MDTVVEKTLSSLRSRHINAIFAENPDEVNQRILDLIPRKAVVGIGDSTAAKQLGIMEVLPKETIGIRDDQKIKIGCFESMCNPIAQAYLFNAEKTEFNVMLGLCVGHDSLFFKYADAPCTVFAVKDRLLGHNPLAAVYNIDTFYRSLKIPQSEK